MGLSDKRLPIKKIAKSLGLEDLDIATEALEGLAYMMLHLAKIKASQEEFLIIYEQCQLNPDKNFVKAMYDVVNPYLNDIREMVGEEN